MKLPLPSDPSRRRSQVLNARLTILLGSLGGMLSGILAWLLYRREQPPAMADRVTVRLKWPRQNVRLRFHVNRAVQTEPLVAHAKALVTVPQPELPQPEPHRMIGFSAGVTTPQRVVPPRWVNAIKPMISSALRLYHRLRRFSLFRHYAWAIVPFLVVTAMHVNNHLYYDTFYGYDMPEHFVNMYSILKHGVLPPPVSPGGNGSGVYEALQSPLFYVLTAWIAGFAEHFVHDGYATMIPMTLFLTSVVWTLLTIVFVQGVMRRVSPILKGLTVCIVMLLPVNILMASMFNNDLPTNILIIAGIMILWFMVRSGREADRTLWLRFAAIAGISVAFKINGVVLLGVGVLLAGYIGFLYLLKHRYATVKRIAVAVMIGLPMMLVPYVINTLHTIEYAGNAVGASTPKRYVWDYFPITFFTTFDTSIFDRPYAFGPGERSFWSLQYVTMHQDYYNHWLNKTIQRMPPSEMLDMGFHVSIPWTRFNNAILLQYLAIPITLIMVFGFVASLFQVVRRPYRAIRDGSILIVILTVVSEGAQYLRFADYADIQSVLIHARYLSFMFVTLFIVGVTWLWRLLARRFWPVTALISFAMVAYCLVAYQLLWLPPM